jgi:hypothetical protein
MRAMRAFVLPLLAALPPPAVALLARSRDGTLRGTFLTTPGDYRWLAGDAATGEAFLEQQQRFERIVRGLLDEAR